MTTYAVIGINHKVAPLDVREIFYLNPLQQDLLLSELKNDPQVAEAFILSTCNRLEIHVRHIQWDDGALAGQQILSLVARIKRITLVEQYFDCFYTFTNEEAVVHLLEVISGLDSMVIGENQILGQAKAAFSRAQSCGILGKYFNLLTAVAVRTGKKVQAETAIGSGGSSVSWAAIATAQQVLGDLSGKSLLLIGSGKMGTLAAEQIASKGFQNVYVINRTHANAVALAEKYNARVVSFCELGDVFAKINLCICAADAPHYILDYAMVESLRRGSCQPLVIIDISMPRNIDPRVAELPNIRVFDIDHLNKPIAESLQKRQAAISDVQSIINKKRVELSRKWQKICEHESRRGASCPENAG